MRHTGLRTLPGNGWGTGQVRRRIHRRDRARAVIAVGGTPPPRVHGRGRRPGVGDPGQRWTSHHHRAGGVARRHRAAPDSPGADHPTTAARFRPDHGTGGLVGIPQHVVRPARQGRRPRRRPPRQHLLRSGAQARPCDSGARPRAVPRRDRSDRPVPHHAAADPGRRSGTTTRTTGGGCNRRPDAIAGARTRTRRLSALSRRSSPNSTP